MEHLCYYDYNTGNNRKQVLIITNGVEKRMKPNQDIRNAVEENGFKLWELAEALGIYDGNLSRKLRRELPTDQKEHIFRVIDRMVERRQMQEGE